MPPMKYTLPHLVKDTENTIEIMEIVYDGNDGTHKDEKVDVSVARIKIAGNSRLAIRWNISPEEYNDTAKLNGEIHCVGMPALVNQPLWFIIPKETFEINSGFFKRVIEKLAKE
jgi:hypothetical protein